MEANLLALRVLAHDLRGRLQVSNPSEVSKVMAAILVAKGSHGARAAASSRS